MIKEIKTQKYVYYEMVRGLYKIYKYTADILCIFIFEFKLNSTF